MDYRFYLLGQDGHIKAAETFSAPDHVAAQETANFVYNACNDEFEWYELWHTDERVGGGCDRARLSLSEVVSARQENILDLEDRLQRGFACVRSTFGNRRGTSKPHVGLAYSRWSRVWWDCGVTDAWEVARREAA